MSTPLALFLSLLLLGGNAFFVAAEFALVAARRTEIEPMAERGSWLAGKTLLAMENVSLSMATAQLGITLCTLGLGALAKPALAHFLEDLLGGGALAVPFSVGVALLFVAGLHVVLGEMVPKNAALAIPSKMALALAVPLRAFSALFFPIVWTLNEVANWVLRVLGFQPRDEVASSFTRDEVAGLVEESRREGVLEEEHLLPSALRFEERRVSLVALPIQDWVCVSEDATPSDLRAIAARYGFSRFPVFSSGEVLGYLHAKDALLDTDQDEPFSRSDWRSLPKIDQNESLRSALETMQHYDSHLARVMRGDQVVGLVALEDIIEELVGEVQDRAGRIVRAF